MWTMLGSIYILLVQLDQQRSVFVDENEGSAIGEGGLITVKKRCRKTFISPPTNPFSVFVVRES